MTQGTGTRLLLAIGIFVTACTQPADHDAPPEVQAPIAMALTPGTCSSPTAHTVNSPQVDNLAIYLHWVCGQTIYVNTSGIASSTYRTILQNAVQEWNDALDFQATGIMRLVTTQPATGAYRTVTVSMPGVASGLNTDDGWWGQYAPQQPSVPNSITLHHDGTANSGSLYAVMLQELAGIVGYNDAWDGGSAGGAEDPIAGINDHCSRILNPVNDKANETVCMHDAEGIWDAYHVATSSAHVSRLSRHIITGLNQPGVLKLATGEVAQVNLTSVEARRAHPNAQINPLEITYSWARTGGAAALFQMVPTNSGRTMTITAGTTAGTGEIEATITNTTKYSMGTFLNRWVSVQVLGRQLTKAAGDNQSALPGAVLPIKPKVHLQRTDGVAIPGATVTFSIAGGGGSANPLTAVTDANGDASTTWTLGASAGSNSLKASSPNAADVVFAATAAAFPTVTAFTYYDCSSYVANNTKTYNTYSVNWTTSSAPGGTVIYQLGESSTSSSSTAAIVSSGAASAGQALIGNAAPLAGPYLKGTVTVNRYWWIRLKDTVSGTTGPWTQLASPKFPIKVNACTPSIP